MIKRPHNAKPPPEARAILPVNIVCTAAQHAKLVEGEHSTEMFQWEIVYEDPWLHLYRGSGHCCFGVRFEPDGDRYRSVEAWVTRDPDVMGSDWAFKFGGTSVEANGLYLQMRLFAMVNPGKQVPAGWSERYGKLTSDYVRQRQAEKG